MKIRIAIIAFHLGFALWGGLLHAQLVTDGGSVTISATTNLPGNLVVGTNSGNTSLTIGAGGTVRDFNGQIGLNASSDSNTVTIQSATGAWINTNSLTVGVSGAGNILRLRTGGFISADSTRIGDNPAADFNSAILSGNNSVWTNAGNVVVGFDGSENFLLLTNGPTLINDTGIIGSQSGSQSNRVLLSDSGTLWTNRSELRVGGAGSHNSLIVSNDATVSVNGDFILGRNAGSSDNTATLEGGNILVAGNTDIRTGKLVIKSGVLSTAGLLMTNGSNSELFLNGGTLIASGGYVRYSSDFVVGLLPGDTNAVFDLRAGQMFTVEGQFTLGANAENSRMFITNGGVFRVIDISFIGSATGSDGHLALISGTGSTWSNTAALNVGYSSAANQLIISNGGQVVVESTSIGATATSVSNSVTVTGTNSALAGFGNSLLYVGNAGDFNKLQINNGGRVADYSGHVGHSSDSNMVIVTGGGSVWSNFSQLAVGSVGAANSMIVSNGGRVETGYGIIGYIQSSSNNEARVTGPDSVWTNKITLYVGRDGSRNRLIITNGGTVGVSDQTWIGEDPASTGNLLEVDNGTLLAGDELYVSGGTLRLNGGSISAGHLVMTNSLGTNEFNQGTMSAGQANVSNGRTFIVGNGSGLAAYLMTKTNFAHVFANGLLITNNAALGGNGNIGGNVTIGVGGRISPGASIGKIIITNSPTLRGTVVMEISQNGAAVTNDVLQVNSSLAYAGSLLVTNIGPSSLTFGEKFKLFDATSYSGAFTNITLPALSVELIWTNKLLVDGSMEINSVGLPVLGTVSAPGTNLVFPIFGGPAGAAYTILTTTNIITPMAGWTTNQTGTFDGSGNASITNGINKTTQVLFFRVRIP